MRDRSGGSHLGIPDANEALLLLLTGRDTHSLCLQTLQAQVAGLAHWHQQDMEIAVAVGEVMLGNWVSRLVVKDLRADGCYVNES